MIKNYGKRIIETLFTRRTKCAAICPKLASKTEVDSDRSDIRVFEVGLSAEQYGDYEQGTRITAQEAESTRLISIAKRHGLFIDQSQWEAYGDRKRLPSGESIVYLSEDGKTVTKLRNPFAKSTIKRMHAQDAIYEHLIHNILFPSTRYQFKGITQDASGVRIVLTQQYISDIFGTPSQKEIDQYLVTGLGLTSENRYYYGNDYVAITDVFADSDNVLTNGEDLLFIDPIIQFKKPAPIVIEYYCKHLQS